ncbi:MAG: hypothetical protein EA370_17145 [Wenzhouxiangella sp.]|nr:MAG: hypothetical protein EA370_17145 [Wenzhouxiangella sp.]
MKENTPNRTNNLSPGPGATNASTIDRITRSAHDGIDSASKAAHPSVDRAATGAHKAIESADEMAHQAAEAFDKAGIKGEELLSTSTNYLREHPLLTLGLAVGTGYVLSRLLASR